MVSVVSGIYLLGNSKGGKVSYDTVRSQWRRATAKTGVEDAHIHDLRAKAGTDTRAAGGDSKIRLGHKSESSHARYMRGLETPLVEPTRRKAS
jgi:integrase